MIIVIHFLSLFIINRIIDQKRGKHPKKKKNTKKLKIKIKKNQKFLFKSKDAPKIKSSKYLKTEENKKKKSARNCEGREGEGESGKSKQIKFIFTQLINVIINRIFFFLREKFFHLMNLLLSNKYHSGICRSKSFLFPSTPSPQFLL